MSSINSGRSLWPLRASIAAVLFVALAPIAGAQQPSVQRGDLERVWYRTTEALEPLNIEVLRERTDELLQVSGRLGLKRLTPFADALVIRSRNLDPVERLLLLRQAERLDPSSPEAGYALAATLYGDGEIIPATGAVVRASIALLRDGRLGGRVRASLLVAALPIVGLALLLWAILAVRRVAGRVWHDLSEMGALFRLGPNAPVLALIVIGLPVFIAGDPVWLVLWIFALSWAYFSAPQKVLGLLALVLVMASPTLLEVGFRDLTHPRNAVLEATAALDEFRYAPMALRELTALASTFGDDPDYYRLVGDCYRQAGMYDAAASTYREGLRIKPTDGSLQVALGTIDYLQGDFNAALQAFDTARAAGVDPVVSNYNLSLTLAQTYHFRESEAAMEAARSAGEARLQSLTRSRDQQQLIIPRFSAVEARALLDRKDPLTLLNRGILPPPLQRERTVLHPLAIAALVSLLFALGHFLVRERTGGLAHACIKCGRPFCRRCKLARESQSYCTQCVNIFLRKDMVSIDAQVAKRQQVARYQRVQQIERRLYDVVLPGSGIALVGRPLLGAALAACAVVGVGAASFWFPRFLSPILLGDSLLPIQVIGWLAWAAAAVIAQVVPVGRR